MLELDIFNVKLDVFFHTYQSQRSKFCVQHIPILKCFKKKKPIFITHLNMNINAYMYMYHLRRVNNKSLLLMNIEAGLGLCSTLKEMNGA